MESRRNLLRCNPGPPCSGDRPSLQTRKALPSVEEQQNVKAFCERCRGQPAGGNERQVRQAPVWEQASLGRLFGQFLENVTTFSHHILSNIQLPTQLWVARFEFNTVESFDGEERVAYACPEPIKNLLGQNDAGRVADGRDLRFLD